jgi:formate dehydrogenase subunit delta
MSATKLVRMANQIATFFRHQPDDEAVASTVQHIKDFWNPVMRREIFAYLDTSEKGLDPLALKALRKLKELEGR